MATKKATATDEQAVVMELPGIETGLFTIGIVGDSPLIVHKWTEKARKEILDKQMKKAKSGKVAKDPVHDYLDCIYYLDEAGNSIEMPEELEKANCDTPKEQVEEALKKCKFGFPTIGFKASALDAGYQQGVIPKKTTAQGAFHILGEYAVIEGMPEMREDMVRVGAMTKVADIRFRPQFQSWKTTLTIRYNKNAISREQIVNLLNYGGFAVGVGEWRISKKGNFGCFHCE